MTCIAMPEPGKGQPRRDDAGRGPPICQSQFVAKQYISPALPLILSWSTLQPRVPCEEFHEALATGSGLVPL